MTKTIEESLAENGKHWQTTVGDSMMPMLRDRENIVEIVRAEGDLKKYDLPLYKRPDGKYVLHRILKVKKDSYITCGDNRYARETVPKEWIVGVASGYFKGQKFVSVSSFRYRLYVHLRCDFFYVRAGIIYLKFKIKRLFKKEKRKM